MPTFNFAKIIGFAAPIILFAMLYGLVHTFYTGTGWGQDRPHSANPGYIVE